MGLGIVQAPAAFCVDCQAVVRYFSDARVGLLRVVVCKCRCRDSGDCLSGASVAARADFGRPPGRVCTDGGAVCRAQRPLQQSGREIQCRYGLVVALAVDGVRVFRRLASDRNRPASDLHSTTGLDGGCGNAGQVLFGPASGRAVCDFAHRAQTSH